MIFFVSNLGVDADGIGVDIFSKVDEGGTDLLFLLPHRARVDPHQRQLCVCVCVRACVSAYLRW